MWGESRYVGIQWIVESDSDPHGWFQWYCRLYQGRRCVDDERQVSRWLESAVPKGRFRRQLRNKIFAAERFNHVNNVRISPVIRQTFLNWGLASNNNVGQKCGDRKSVV